LVDLEKRPFLTVERGFCFGKKGLPYFFYRLPQRDFKRKIAVCLFLPYLFELEMDQILVKSRGNFLRLPRLETTRPKGNYLSLSPPYPIVHQTRFL